MSVLPAVYQTVYRVHKMYIKQDLGEMHWTTEVCVWKHGLADHQTIHRVTLNYLSLSRHPSLSLSLYLPFPSSFPFTLPTFNSIVPH